MLDTIEPNSIDSDISDFPYNLAFMGKKWDNTKNFYDWNKARADKLFKVMKCGGYVAIFGHPKTNHRMKCAFEDAGFRIVEEIDWVYLTGMPKNQDIGKLFDKAAGAKRKIVGAGKWHSDGRTTAFGTNGVYNQTSKDMIGDGKWETNPATEDAKKWNGWKTAGLKPAHEPITIFQKPSSSNRLSGCRRP